MVLLGLCAHTTCMLATPCSNQPRAGRRVPAFWGRRGRWSWDETPVAEALTAALDPTWLSPVLWTDLPEPRPGGVSVFGTGARDAGRPPIQRSTCYSTLSARPSCACRGVRMRAPGSTALEAACAAGLLPGVVGSMMPLQWVQLIMHASAEHELQSLVLGQRARGHEPHQGPQPHRHMRPMVR